MKKTYFEWDEDKDQENQKKHNVSFSQAQHAFLDAHRIIVEDEVHSAEGESILLYRSCRRRDHDCSLHL